MPSLIHDAKVGIKSCRGARECVSFVHTVYTSKQSRGKTFVVRAKIKIQRENFHGRIKLLVIMNA